jgi:hypothetical protein
MQPIPIFTNKPKKETEDASVSFLGVKAFDNFFDSGAIYRLIEESPNDRKFQVLFLISEKHSITSNAHVIWL